MRILILFMLIFGSLTKVPGQSQTRTLKDEIQFSGLTFLSSACNGTCPDISMNIYPDNRIEISRIIFKRKGEPDTKRSGNYKGNLTNEELNKIIILWRAIDWDTVSFPKALCCDAPIVTLMFSYNGSYKRFRSMTPPESTRELITHLTKLGSDIILPKYDKPIDFEDFD